MTLYRYVPSKDALLDGVVALVLTDLAINPAAADWRQELRGLATSFRGLALAHPNAVPLLVTRPLTSPLGQRPPATLRPLENFLELLIRAGFSPADALHAYRLFFGFLHGHILDELQEIIDSPDEADDLLRLGLHRLPRREFPRIRAVAPDLASYDGAAHLRQGVALMITGLQSASSQHPPPPPETAQQLVFVRFLKLIGTAVPDGLELHRKLRRSAPQRHRLEADIRKWINAWSKDPGHTSGPGPPTRSSTPAPPPTPTADEFL